LAELAIREWMQDRLAAGEIDLVMSGNVGTLRDKLGNVLQLVYDNETKAVYTME